MKNFFGVSVAEQLSFWVVVVMLSLRCFDIYKKACQHDVWVEKKPFKCLEEVKTYSNEKIL